MQKKQSLPLSRTAIRPRVRLESSKAHHLHETERKALQRAHDLVVPSMGPRVNVPAISHGSMVARVRKRIVFGWRVVIWIRMRGVGRWEVEGIVRRRFWVKVVLGKPVAMEAVWGNDWVCWSWERKGVKGRCWWVVLERRIKGGGVSVESYKWWCDGGRMWSIYGPFAGVVLQFWVEYLGCFSVHGMVSSVVVDVD